MRFCFFCVWGGQGSVMESVGIHQPPSKRCLPSLLLILLLIIFQVVLPKMVIASNSRGPHQLPLAFIPANKNVSSTARKPQAKETKLINRHLSRGVLSASNPLGAASCVPSAPIHAGRNCPPEGLLPSPGGCPQVGGEGNKLERLRVTLKWLEPPPSPQYTLT